jgi:hypothetical protein
MDSVDSGPVKERENRPGDIPGGKPQVNSPRNRSNHPMISRRKLHNPLGQIWDQMRLDLPVGYLPIDRKRERLSC